MSQVEALRKALAAFLHKCEFVRQADRLNMKILNPPECGKPAVFVQYGYEGEEEWRCTRHAKLSSASDFHEDEKQVAARAALEMKP